MKEIGKIESVNVKSCEVVIEKYNGDKFGVFIGGKAKQGQWHSLFYWFNRKKIYGYVWEDLATDKAKRFIHDLVKGEYVIIDNCLIKYADIKDVRIVNVKDLYITPEYYQFEDTVY